MLIELKRSRQKTVINEEPSDKFMRELKDEVEMLCQALMNNYDNRKASERRKGLPGERSFTMVRGSRISKTQKLKSGFRIILGNSHMPSLNNPGETKKERECMNLTDSLVPRRESRKPHSPREPTDKIEMTMSPSMGSEVMN
ncbi:unnamed protein product [Rhizopus stolonifer]